MNPDDETLKDIRRWYHEHGLPYQEEDWGPRGLTGESAGSQVQEGERTKEVRSSASTPDRMWWWEKQQFPWRARTPTEQEWAETLEDFFTPYLAMLAGPKLRLMEQVFNDTRTYEEAGALAGMSRQGAHQAVQRALRALTRLIAEDNPVWEPPADGRRRNYVEEEEAARFVFVKYVTDRLG